MHYRTGLTFATTAVAGAYSGGRVAGFIPGAWLLVAFSLMMLATAIAMIRGRRSGPRARGEVSTLGVLVYGIVVGFITGLVGAGGGFLVVPALTLLGGLSMGAAVGTSLLVITINSFAGLAGHLANVSLDWGLALAVTAAAIGGSIAGERIAGHIPHRALRQAFGYFVLATGIVFLVTQAPPGLGEAVATHPLVTAVTTAAVLTTGIAVALRRRRAQPASTPARRNNTTDNDHE